MAHQQVELNELVAPVVLLDLHIVLRVVHVLVQRAELVLRAGDLRKVRPPLTGEKSLHWHLMNPLVLSAPAQRVSPPSAHSHDHSSSHRKRRSTVFAASVQ